MVISEQWSSNKEEDVGKAKFVKEILLDLSSTPLHCLAYSLNTSHEWLSEDSHRLSPHQDMELTLERKKCFKMFFVDVNVRSQVNVEDRDLMSAKSWWLVHGARTPILQKIALKLLGQP
ncbi:hypothetical protein GmHk_10G028482 [Glycine max]|nr:hypothetical protein GmHk_10G028482 [Glycine max]